MFKWPKTPSERADAHELADFAELSAWRSNTISTTAISQALGRIAENDHSYDLADEEESEEADYPNVVPETGSNDQLTEGADLELERRQGVCHNGYPFILGENGYTLSVSQEHLSDKHIIYKYLLLATRLDMNANRRYSNYDGTLLLEELAAEVAQNYLGSRAESLVFGTASNISSFAGRVDFLCQQIGEGGGFENRRLKPPTEKDGKLDVVAWKNFTDQLPGKLILFGQCKTGTHYEDELAKLQPDAFCKKYMRSLPVVNPVRAFFVSEALPETNWHNMSVDAGILFDRCRIIDFCDSVSDVTLGKIEAWTAAAAQANDLPGL